MTESIVITDLILGIAIEQGSQVERTYQEDQAFSCILLTYKQKCLTLNIICFLLHKKQEFYLDFLGIEIKVNNENLLIYLSNIPGAPVSAAAKGPYHNFQRFKFLCIKTMYTW